MPRRQVAEEATDKKGEMQTDNPKDDSYRFKRIRTDGRPD
jgi:hypothetical protein